MGETIRETARAAVGAAHSAHELVFAHPSNLEGVLVARDSGVDVLAHAPDTVDGIGPADAWPAWWRQRVQDKRDGAPWAASPSTEAAAPA